jgi:hypothetical protein
MGGAQQTITGQIASDNRLYDSMDELTFDPSRLPLSSANPALYPATIGANATGISPNTRTAIGASPLADAQIINQRRFFIPAHSRMGCEFVNGAEAGTGDPGRSYQSGTGPKMAV